MSSGDLFDVFSSEEAPVAKKPRKSTELKRKSLNKGNSGKKATEDGLLEDTDGLFETKNDDQSFSKSKISIAEEEMALEKLLPQINTAKVPDAKPGCVHEMCTPKDVVIEDFKPLSPNPAKQYPFKLDPFQEEAIRCIENKRSVLVSAHTSAGKTVVAEYAVATSLRDKQRVIYTTPIKALSNQKFREMTEEFTDVGLMTGDVTINPSAGCLIMTTEILRSMLYRGSEIMREVAWVIFDEIHYMRDKERGVVWEETIILLPDNVHYVFLSATIPNARQFAEWVANLHQQSCHVVYTDYRPTPLQHYIYPAGAEGLHLVVNEKGEFREDNFNLAMESLKTSGESGGSGGGKKNNQQVQSNIFKIVKMINERNFQPVIVFSFSKKECEAYALQQQKLDFNTAEEKQLVEEVFNNAIDCLSDEDKKLPQVEQMLPVLKRGIGIHHSGLLPILKEAIEILFGEGLVKALFATETFAMGLNMPARTVVFTNARKYDGKNFRWLSSGEYIQMSGRAGRRGIDERGIVILMVDEKMQPEVGRNLIKGQADPLNSAFHLTYNMVLNLLRVEEINPEYMLEKSFFQFQQSSSVPKTIEAFKKIQSEHESLKIPNEEKALVYYKIRQQLEKLRRELHQFMVTPKYALPFMQPGRLVKVKHEDIDYGWGAVVNFQKSTKSKADEAPKYIVEVLLNVDPTLEEPLPGKPNIPGRCELQVAPVMLNTLEQISVIRLHLPKDLRNKQSREGVAKSIQEVCKRFPQGFPQLDLCADMGIKDPAAVEVIRRIETLEHRMFKHPLHNDPQLAVLFDLCDRCNKMEQKMIELKADLKSAKNIIQMDELKCRKRVLRRLGYASENDVIETKGRVACEISSGDELVLTEMMFNGVFNDLTVEQAVGILSCFAFQEKGSENPNLEEGLSKPFRILQETAKRVARVSADCKITIDEDDYVSSFRPSLMEISHAWAKGSPFHEVCKLSEIFEGSIIRGMRRLEELMREMTKAAKAIGNADLEIKFNKGIEQIKRDIVFAASLYL